MSIRPWLPLHKGLLLATGYTPALGPRIPLLHTEHQRKSVGQQVITTYLGRDFVRDTPTLIIPRCGHIFDLPSRPITCL